MRPHAVVLNIQDTTELDFNGRQTAGLGPLSYEAQRGMYLHPTYAVSPQREPLGVLDAWMWAREPRDADGVRGGIKESERWIEGYERVAERALELPQVRQVVFDLLPGRGRQARRVTQSLRADVIELADGSGSRLSMHCVLAQEIDPPAGVKPVVWRLLSNRPIHTLEQATELVDWYRARWEIELFFLILKEGCRIEALQLGEVARIETALALYMVVAWRINRLIRLGRSLPQLPADLLFETDEWQAAYVLNKKKPPKTVPPLNTVVRLIAQLGGFLARKGDGEPGAKTLWLGLRNIAVFVQGLRFARQTL